MNQENTIKLFEQKQVRTHWDDLKVKLKNEGSELSEKIGQLKAKTGKKVITPLNAKTSLKQTNKKK